MFSGLLQKDLLKGQWNLRQIFFQTKLLSRLSHKVCRLLCSQVLLRKLTYNNDCGLALIQMPNFTFRFIRAGVPHFDFSSAEIKIGVIINLFSRPKFIWLSPNSKSIRLVWSTAFDPGLKLVVPDCKRHYTDDWYSVALIQEKIVCLV